MSPLAEIAQEMDKLRRSLLPAAAGDVATVRSLDRWLSALRALETTHVVVPKEDAEAGFRKAVDAGICTQAEDAHERGEARKLLSESRLLCLHAWGDQE